MRAHARRDNGESSARRFMVQVAAYLRFSRFYRSLESKLEVASLPRPAGRITAREIHYELGEKAPRGEARRRRGSSGMREIRGSALISLGG